MKSVATFVPVEKKMETPDTDNERVLNRHKNPLSHALRFVWWASILFVSQFLVKIRVKGDLKEVYKNNPRLLLISNHASHIDAVSISLAIPFSMWRSLYVAAAKDYFFKNKPLSFFSHHCLGAVPIDRKDRKRASVEMCMNLLSQLQRVWFVIFPEGTRSKDGKIAPFKRGVSMFSQETQTPILFLYIEGNKELWPKGALFPKPGVATVHVGPVQQPASTEEIERNYREWAKTINPNVELMDQEKFKIG